MDIGYLTSDAVKYPSNDLKKVIFLGILIFISFLIIPGFLALGYAFRSLKWSIADVNELPDFNEWGEMFFDGMKVFLVQLAYFIVPSIIILASIWASISSLITLQNTGNFVDPAATFSLMGGSIILGVILAVIFGVFFTIALANMAYYDSELAAAFRFRELFNIINAIGWVDFIIWYIMMVLIGFGIGFLAVLLGFIPIIGWALIILILYPYLYLLYARALGLLFISGFE